MPMIFAPFLFAAAVDGVCRQRQEFFRRTAEGTLALIADANTLSEARTAYSRWCQVDSADTQENGGDRVYFGLNNRSDSVRQPSYYVVKVFRRSRATEFRPLLSLRRIGDWRGASCGNPRLGSRGSSGYQYSVAGTNVVSSFLSQLQNYRRLNVVTQCGVLDEWYANAFGVPYLSLERDMGFLADIPNRVSNTGLQRWSLSITAFSYGTVGDEDRTAAFPILGITRDGADEIIVQYISSGQKYHEFVLARNS